MQSKVHALRLVDCVVCSCGELILLLIYIVALANNIYKTVYFVCSGRWYDDIFYYFSHFLFRVSKFQKNKIICTIIAA